MMLWDMDREDFVDLCKKGDEQALNQLYKTYSGKMMKICLRYVPDRQIAQDLLHDGFIVIFTSIGSLRNPERSGKLDGSRDEEYRTSLSQSKQYG